ncbi:MAG TPA: gamma-glutamylcyclotransferase [Dongiaceae bacterium]|nr:gamma-glutamylcyclotransferase [Dongiaceae bacterium]
MTLLTREALRSGTYLEHFEPLPPEVRWNEERMRQSLRGMLEMQPPDGEIWVFGYGSLIWKPLLNFDESCWGRLDGWHRSFCIRSIVGRGSADAPGRTLAVEAGGSTQGKAFRISASTLDEDLWCLWVRETFSGVYAPVWAPVTLEDGRTVPAILFTAALEHPLFEADATVATIAPLIAKAAGPLGTNTEYVLNLQDALRAKGLVDPYVDELAARLR